MNIDINFQNHTPIYSQVADQVKHKIAVGELSSGEQLPTVRHMATALGVNFNTIARAYRLLDQAGIISTQHGRGSYILTQVNPETHARQRRNTLVSLTENYLAKCHQQGHSTKQVENILNKRLKLWDQSGSPVPQQKQSDQQTKSKN